MKKKRFILLILTIILLTISNQKINAADSESKNILILNSYHSGFAWTDDQTSGILSSLSSLDIDYNVSIEYLDWKRYPTQNNLTNEYNSLKFKYEDQKMDVVVCTDDAAFSFAMKYREEIFSNAPIVFLGVNSNGLNEIAKNQSNYTGVLEELDPERTIQAALKINPSIKNLYLIYDNTESGLSTGELCINAAKTVAPNLKVTSLNKLSCDNIIKIVSNIDKNSMVLVTTYFSDINGVNFNHENFCEKLSETSPVPIYDLYDFALGHGIMGGNLIIGKLQGEEAGELAKRILNGEAASSIAITDRKTTQFTFDYTMLKKYDISSSRLPQDSKIINKPFSFIETYRTLVYVVLFIFFLLITFTIVLLFYIKKIKSMQIKLSENHVELTNLYEELTASEEELRAQFAEITESQNQLKEYSSKLHHLAYHDTLTGLYNRLYIYEEIEQQLGSSSNTGALLFIDLDNFKFINDALGHSIGDVLLKLISTRLEKFSSDNTDIIRLGGDEFILYSKNVVNKASVEDFAKEIIAVFAQPFTILENSLTVSISIGIVLFPENGSDIDTLLRNADMAMYKVKNEGKNGYFFFNNLLKDELIERIQIEHNFKKALAENEFTLFYQPQINTSTADIDGFEALIRWFSPELGMLSPLKFVSIAEETGFITILGEWILRTSCIYINELNDRYHKNYSISVNISVIQLFQDNFVDIVKQVLKDSNLSPENLELEITESVIMESPELIVEKIKVLRDIGISIALDDFGTGYSSLSYLRNIPITTLKIDKIFVDDIANPNSTTDVTDTIITLGHKMNLSIVAEGVETEAQLDYLKKNRCDKIQGYFYSKPLPVLELERFVEEFI